MIGQSLSWDLSNSRSEAMSGQLLDILNEFFFYFPTVLVDGGNIVGGGNIGGSGSIDGGIGIDGASSSCVQHNEQHVNPHSLKRPSAYLFAFLVFPLAKPLVIQNSLSGKKYKSTCNPKRKRCFDRFFAESHFLLLLLFLFLFLLTFPLRCHNKLTKLTVNGFPS